MNNGGTLKKSDYILRKPYIKTWLDNKPEWKYWDEVGPLALATGVHIIIVSCFIADLYGMTDEIAAKIERDKKFYNIVEICE